MLSHLLTVLARSRRGGAPSACRAPPSRPAASTRSSPWRRSAPRSAGWRRRRRS